MEMSFEDGSLIDPSPLCTAIIKNNVDMVRLLASQTKTGPSEAPSPVLVATQQEIGRENSDILRILVNSGFDLNAKDDIGRTALHRAADYNQLENMEILLASEDVDVNDTDLTGRNSLHCLLDEAPFTDNDSLLRGIQMLLDRGVDVNCKTRLGQTGLHLVFRQDCRAIPQLLTQIIWNVPEARLDATDNDGNNVLHYLVSEFGGEIQDQEEFVEIVNEKEEFIRELLRGKFIPFSSEFLVSVINCKDESGYTPLHTYIDGKHFTLETVGLMIDSGSDVNLSNNLGVTPLMSAAIKYKDDLVEKLLNAGAHVNAKDCFGQTALFRVRTTRSLNLLHKYGAKLDIKDKFGRHPIVLSSCYDCEDLPGGEGLQITSTVSQYRPLAEQFLSLGVDVNCTDNFGSTPLHYATWHDDCSAVNMLLENGADPSIADHRGFKPMDLALHVGNYSVASKLDSLVLGGSTQERHNEFRRLQGLVLNEKDVPSVALGLAAQGVFIEPCDILEQMLRSPSHGLVGNRAEVGEVTDSVREMMTKMGKMISEQMGVFKSRVFPTGSGAENTQVCDPHEFDFVFCLENFSQKCRVVQPPDLLESGFTLLRPGDPVDPELAPFLDTSGNICSSLVRDKFQDKVINVINTPSFWNFPNIYFDGLIDVAGHKPIININVIWFGTLYKQLVVSIDIVPAVHVIHWTPEEFKHDKLPPYDELNSPGFFALFHPPEDNKGRSYLRLSCAPLEIDHIRKSPVGVREAYAATKLLKYFSPWVIFEDTDAFSFEDDATDGENEAALSSNKVDHGKTDTDRERNEVTSDNNQVSPCGNSDSPNSIELGPANKNLDASCNDVDLVSNDVTSDCNDVVVSSYEITSDNNDTIPSSSKAACSDNEAISGTHDLSSSSAKILVRLPDTRIKGRERGLSQNVVTEVDFDGLETRTHVLADTENARYPPVDAWLSIQTETKAVGQLFFLKNNKGNSLRPKPLTPKPTEPVEGERGVKKTPATVPPSRISHPVNACQPTASAAGKRTARMMLAGGLSQLLPEAEMSSKLACSAPSAESKSDNAIDSKGTARWIRGNTHVDITEDSGGTGPGVTDVGSTTSCLERGPDMSARISSDTDTNSTATDLTDNSNGDAEIWEGGDAVAGKDVISSYMLKNCLLHVTHDLQKAGVSLDSLTTVEITTKVFEHLKSRANELYLPVFFLPFQNIFTFVNCDIRKMDEKELRERTTKRCHRISTFCDVCLNILSYTPPEITDAEDLEETDVGMLENP